ncbi:TPA: hypothetical protein ENS27_04085 [bacterium]|nr:hypothetical protein [bacterium]
MKIFFITSPRIKEKYPENIKKIYDTIQEIGYVHSSNIVQHMDASHFYGSSTEEMKKNYKEMVEGIKKADIVVFEASMHSLAIGYLLNLTLENGKPAVVLYSDNTVAPFLFENIQNDKLVVASYNINNVKKVLKEMLDVAGDQIDVRFNFFVSSKIVTYLDWIARQKKLPRAVYLRRLIEEDMKKNKDFLEE